MYGLRGMLLMACVLCARILQGHTQLEGTTAHCDIEGEDIYIPSISDDPCISCICTDGEVTCSKERCAMLDGCHMVLFDKPNDQCCDVCKGCSVKQREHDSGALWVDSDDICRINMCHAAVVTSSKVRCHVTCRKPIPVSGECCPVCPGCVVGNQSYKEGDIFRALSDPCATCACKGGNVKCSKQACPVLNCPARYVVTPVGSCCPICKGSRSVFDLKDRACLFRSRLFPNQTDVNPDPCTNCTCISGTLHCARRVCPPLLCPSGTIEVLPNVCCPRCVKPKRPCKFRRTVYKDGSKWQRDRCTNCSCTDGEIHCQADQCRNSLQCPGNSRLRYTRGSCCPECIEDDAVCAVFGDPHYRTFDGHIFSFQGPCTYTLVQDCINKHFAIRVRNSARLSSQFAWTKAVSVRIGDFRISLQQRLRVKLNRERILLPHEEPGLFSIMLGGHSVVVKTVFGVKVVWDGHSYAEIVLSPSFKNKVCGLCGNYNGRISDDMIGRDGVLYLNSREFGDTWLVGKDQTCKQPMPLLNTVTSQCLLSRRHELRAEKECEELIGPMFEPCRNRVDVEPYYRSCFLDMCDCPSRERCACESLTAYARACEREQVELEWRVATKCGESSCPKGSVYKTCANSCETSCESIADSRESCMKPCLPGCECRPGRVRHDDKCILRELCPYRNRTMGWL